VGFINIYSLICKQCAWCSGEHAANDRSCRQYSNQIRLDGGKYLVRKIWRQMIYLRNLYQFLILSSILPYLYLLLSTKWGWSSVYWACIEFNAAHNLQPQQLVGWLIGWLMDDGQKNFLVWLDLWGDLRVNQLQAATGGGEEDWQQDKYSGRWVFFRRNMEE